MVSVELRASDCRTLSRLDESDFADLLPSGDFEHFPMLGLVDLYGDTWFSSVQMQLVRRELSEVTARQPAGSAHEALRQIAMLAEECASTPHTFLVFVGD
jgi:hypothetical protein